LERGPGGEAKKTPPISQQADWRFLLSQTRWCPTAGGEGSKNSWDLLVDAEVRSLTHKSTNPRSLASPSLFGEGAGG